MGVRKVFSIAAVVGVAVATIGVGGTASGATGATPSTSPAASAGPTYPWPEAHQNPQLTGVSNDPAISDTNSSQLGVHWMSSLTAQSLTSPVVGYNAVLGKTLVYAGSEGGWFSAFDATTGATIWSVNLSSAIRVTPVIDGKYIWVASTYAPLLMKLNAATGAKIMVGGKACQVPIFSVAEASPIVVTPAGGKPTVYMGSNDTSQPGPIYAIDEATCAVNWTFSGYLYANNHAGIWDMMSYGVSATGEPLVLFGTADPDARIYALDALTGKLVWAFTTHGTATLADIGAGVTVAMPGTPAGGADGMTYTPSKDGYVYAVDLTTGVEKWEYQYSGGLPVVANGARGTAALSGTDLIVGTTTGTFDLNALTGAMKWQQSAFPKGDEVLGAPAITGPAGHQVVLVTDIFGTFKVLSLATGAQLYTYQTHNYLASSPVEVDGNVLFTAADGFLYDFSLGGSNNPTAPTTTVSSPVQGTTVANPSPSPLTISGTASDPTGVTSVSVAVQEDGQTGTWWSASKQTWQAGPFNNPATLASPGATTTNWTITVPMPARGTVIVVRAAATNTGNIADTSSDASKGTPARVDFTVAPSATAPTLSVGTARMAPGAQLMVTGGGYQAGESVAITLPTTPITNLATVVASSTGLLPSTPITVPVGANFGPITVSATGQTSGLTGSAPVIISNNWDQFGNLTTVKNATNVFNNVPAQTNFELNDSALNNSVAASGKYYLNLAYNFPSGNGIHSTVAIDNGHAFFGNDGGDFFSTDVHSGAPTWQKHFTAGIVSSAAVDSSMVIFGTNANSVVALNESTGAVMWTTPTTSPVESSPVVYGGVVYVGSDAGTFYAINEQTGAVLWTSVLGAKLVSSPAIDPVHKTVVVGSGVLGDHIGHVTAMSLGGTGVPAAGSVVWSALTGDGVVAAPTYFSNKIFVGSTDNKEYAFNGKTGAPVWTFATGGPITANNVTFGSAIGVGSQDGTIYYLDSVHGTVNNSLVGTIPIVGLSGSVAFAVATLANGAALATRITGVDQTWKYNAPIGSPGFASAPVPNNGNIYMTGLDGSLLVFSGPGRLVY